MEWVRKLVDGKGGGQVQARYRGWVVVGGIPKSLRHAFPVPVIRNSLSVHKISGWS